ncbi:MAG: M28 family peptidase [Thermodesulfobacteriota bacterium]
MSSEFRPEEMLVWARGLYEFGFRRPGTPAGIKAEDYLFGLLQDFGLPKVAAEAVPFVGWFPERAYLVVSGPGGSSSFSAEPVVYTSFTPAAGLTAPLIHIGRGRPEDLAGLDLAGKIALVFYDYGWLDYHDLAPWALHLHDPEGNLNGRGQAMTWITEEEQRIYDLAFQAGAAGLVGVFPLDLTPYLCYEGGNAFIGRTGSIPALGLKKSQGLALKELLLQGRLEATLIQTGETRPAITRNLVGLIPGRSGRVIQVTSHHDSMWLGATEDAAGAAVVLALARHWAGRRPEHTLAFVLEAAECLYVLGSRAYIGLHKDDSIHDLIADLHVEHLAREFVAGPGGALVPTGQIQPRAMFVSRAGPLVDLVKEAVIKHDLQRTVILPADTPLGCPTDATCYHRSGLPVASFISPPLYWNTLEDTWDKIAVETLTPTAAAFNHMIEALMETDPNLIRPPGPPGDGYLRYRE